MNGEDPTPYELLQRVRTIAIVGLSSNPARASNEVAGFLKRRGYACIGINPALAGQSVLGLRVVARLADLAEPIDMVDVFRKSSVAGGVVDEALALRPLPKLIWMQLGVVDAAAKARAEAAGVAVVMDNCPKIVLGG